MFNVPMHGKTFFPLLQLLRFDLIEEKSETSFNAFFASSLHSSCLVCLPAYRVSHCHKMANRTEWNENLEKEYNENKKKKYEKEQQPLWNIVGMIKTILAHIHRDWCLVCKWNVIVCVCDGSSYYYEWYEWWWWWKK